MSVNKDNSAVEDNARYSTPPRDFVISLQPEGEAHSQASSSSAEEEHMWDADTVEAAKFPEEYPSTLVAVFMGTKDKGEEHRLLDSCGSFHIFVSSLQVTISFGKFLRSSSFD
jgi:hypothetical protein